VVPDPRGAARLATDVPGGSGLTGVGVTRHYPAPGYGFSRARVHRGAARAVGVISRVGVAHDAPLAGRDRPGPRVVRHAGTARPRVPRPRVVTRRVTGDRRRAAPPAVHVAGCRGPAARTPRGGTVRADRPAVAVAVIGAPPRVAPPPPPGCRHAEREAEPEAHDPARPRRVGRRRREAVGDRRAVPDGAVPRGIRVPGSVDHD